MLGEGISQRSQASPELVHAWLRRWLRRLSHLKIIEIRRQSTGA
jgi:hypothetical protein